jgi:hypothetical protein
LRKRTKKLLLLVLPRRTRRALWSQLLEIKSFLPLL